MPLGRRWFRSWILLRGVLPFDYDELRIERLDPERGRAAAQDVLDDDHALRPAEAAERGVRRPVRLGDPPGDLDVRDPVGIVDVA